MKGAGMPPPGTGAARGDGMAFSDEVRSRKRRGKRGEKGLSWRMRGGRMEVETLERVCDATDLVA